MIKTRLIRFVETRVYHDEVLCSKSIALQIFIRDQVDNMLLWNHSYLPFRTELWEEMLHHCFKANTMCLTTFLFSLVLEILLSYSFSSHVITLLCLCLDFSFLRYQWFAVIRFLVFHIRFLPASIELKLILSCKMSNYFLRMCTILNYACLSVGTSCSVTSFRLTRPHRTMW